MSDIKTKMSTISVTDSLKYLQEVDYKKIIIDTDGGADDAIAILLALSLNTKEILAITTSMGNTHRNQVIINILRTLRVLNSKVIFCLF